jgi:hypothetical protein
VGSLLLIEHNMGSHSLEPVYAPAGEEEGEGGSSRTKRPRTFFDDEVFDKPKVLKYVFVLSFV